MNEQETRWGAEDLFEELDELKALQDASRVDHAQRMTRLSATTSIPVSRELDIPRAQYAARRMGGFCRLSDGPLAKLATLATDMAEDLVRAGGGFLRVTPVPGAEHLAVLLEAESPEGQTRFLVDNVPLTSVGDGDER